MAKGDRKYSRAKGGAITTAYNNATAQPLLALTLPAAVVSVDGFYSVRGFVHAFRQGSFVAGCSLFVFTGHFVAGALPTASGTITPYNGGANEGGIPSGTVGTIEYDLSGTTITIKVKGVAVAPTDQEITWRGEIRVDVTERPSIVSSP